MSKLSKRTKKLLSIFLTILLIITGTSIVSVLADNVDTSDFEALGSSGVELGASGDRVSMIAVPIENRAVIYSGFEFELETTAPAGKVEITLPEGMDYPEESNMESENAGLVSYNKENRLLALNFQGATLSLGESVNLGESLAVSESSDKIKIKLLPMEVKEFTLQAEHNEGDKAELKINVKSIIAPLSADRNGFALYDGKDLKDGIFAGYTYDGLANNARLLTVNADFGANPTLFIDRKITIKVGKGLKVMNAPGLVASGDGNRWKFDPSTLGDLAQDVEKVTFTRNPDKEFGKFQGEGGTIVYEFGSGVQTASINIQLIGEAQYLYSGLEYVEMEIPNILEITSEKKTNDAAKTVISENAVLESFKVTGRRITMIGNRTETLLIEPDGTAETLVYTHPAPGLITEATAAYQLPAFLTVTEVTSTDQAQLADGDITLEFKEISGNKYVLIHFKNTRSTNYLKIKFKADASAVIGTTGTMTGPQSLSKMKNFYNTDERKTSMGFEVISYKIVGPAEDKLTLYDRTLTTNVPNGVQVPLGGFMAKNEQPKILTDQRLKMEFADTNISVKSARLYTQPNASNNHYIKDLYVETYGGEIFTKESLLVAGYSYIFKLSDHIPGIDSSDGIKVLSYQIPSIPINKFLGYSGTADAAFQDLAYYGTGTVAEGASFTAKMYTTTADDTTFSGPNLQTETTTTVVKSASGLGLEVTANHLGAKVYNPGDIITITHSVTPDGVLSRDGIRYVKGFDFFIRMLPDTKLVEGSVRIHDNINGNISSAKIQTSSRTDNTGAVVNQYSVPSSIMQPYNGIIASNLTLEYKLEVEKTAKAASYNLNDYVFIFPQDAAVVLKNRYMSGDTAIRKNQYNFYAPAHPDYNNLEKLGVGSRTSNSVSFNSKVDFNLSTAANLNNGEWVTYDGTENGTIVLNPAGNAKYRLRMDNNSGQEVSEFVAFIPIPKFNEWATTDPELVPASPAGFVVGKHVQQDKFGWSTSITAEPTVTGSYGASNFTMEYSLAYDLSDRTNSAQWKTWASLSAAERENIKTVRIKTNTGVKIPNGASSDIVFPMALDTVESRAGNINVYSAYIYRDLPASTSYVPSQPIAILLKTGVVNGKVYNDSNNNGQWDAGENGIGGITVNAFKTGTTDPVEVATVTDSNGLYAFNGLDKLQNVDIVFTNNVSDGSSRFTEPIPASPADVTSKKANVVPSSPAAVTGINAGIVNSNALKFNLGYTGPTPPDSLVKFPGELVTELPKEVDYPRANYSLDGWFTKATGGTEVVVTGATTIDQILAKIVADGGTNTLYAQWTRQLADVTVERYKYTDVITDATPIDSNIIVDQNVGGTYTATAANDIVGHTYNAGVSTPSITVDINPASNKVKLYYQANLYNVITDPDNGTPATTTSTRFGTIIPEPQAPSKTGHTPTGSWVDVGNGNAIWNFTTGTVPVGGVSLKATWTVNSYAISFDVNGGTTLAVAPPTSLNYDAVIPNPGVTSRPGYDFKGWFTQTAPGVWGAQYTPGTSKMPDSALALFAKWENNATRATISFNLDGGTYDGAATIADQSLKGGEKVAKPDNAKLAKPGMKPLGWYTAASGGSLWDFDAPLEHALFKNQTLHMVWAPDGAALMTVTYDLDGGLYNGLPANPATTQTWVGQTVSKPNLPLTKDGYLFDAWYIKNSDNSVGAEWNFATVISSGTFGNLNLIAKWTPQPYALTFDENTGTALAPAIKNQSIIFGTKPTQPAAGATNHPGYLLEGWYTVDAGGALVTKWDFVTGTMPSKAIILKANWTVVAAQTVTYTFNPQGGTYTGPAGDLSQVKNAGTTLTKPDETKLTLPGMKFEGWFPNSNGTGAIWNFADKLEHGKFENTTLYAKWSIDPTKKMTVSFDLAGGKYNNTTAITAQQLIIGEKVITPGDSLMSKEGNTFNSWKIKNPNGTAGAPWNFNTEITSANFGNMTLIATWDVNPYNITFNVNGGSALTGAVPTTVNFGTVIPAISVTARPGYIFEGWFDALSPTAQYTPGTSTMPAKNIDLVAKWRVDTSNTVAITFDLKGGKYNGQATIQTQNKTAGSTVDEPTVANLSKPGYSFTKWIVKGTSNEWIFTTVLENADFKNTALEAVWDTDATQTVSADFNLNGGKMGASTTIPSQTLRVLEKITEPAPASLNKEGHTFDAWYLEGSDGKPTTTKWNFNTQITHENWGNKKLIAVWKANPYVVTFDSANGSANKDVSVIFGTKVTEPAKPSKLGHTFGGWYKADNTAWNFNTPMPAANFTLTADWTINNYQVTIDPNNGTTPTNQSIQFGQKVTKPADPSKTGYDFGGWHLANSDGTLGSAWDFATNTVPAKDITIKAQWNIKTYTITVNHNVYATDKTTATLEKTETFTKEHFSTFTAKPIDIPYYTFIQAESDELSFSVDGAKTVSLYYKTDSYTLSVVEELELDVNDRFPEAKNNKLSWEQVVELLEAQTVNSNDPATFAARAAKSVEFSTITSSDYDAVDYSAITDGYTQSFNVTATWGNGNTDSKAVRVKISDRVAPEITNLSDNRRFYFELGKGIATEALFRNFLDNEGVAVVDNYDGELPIILEYLGNKGFESINWGKVGEYAVYLSSADHSGNTSRSAIAISVWGSNPGDGGDGDGKGPGKGPDVDTPIQGDGDGSNGSGNNGNDGSGNYLDDKGNLVDSKGNKLVDVKEIPEGSYLNEDGVLIGANGKPIKLSGNAGGKLPRTGAIIGTSVGLLVILLLAIFLIILKKKKKQKQEQNSKI